MRIYAYGVVCLALSALLAVACDSSTDNGSGSDGSSSKRDGSTSNRDAGGTSGDTGSGTSDSGGSAATDDPRQLMTNTFFLANAQQYKWDRVSKALSGFPGGACKSRCASARSRSTTSSS